MSLPDSGSQAAQRRAGAFRVGIVQPSISLTEGLRRLGYDDTEAALPRRHLGGRHEFIVAKIDDSGKPARQRIDENALVERLTIVGGDASLDNAKFASHLNEKRNDGPDFPEAC